MKTSRWSRWPFGLALALVASLVHANAPQGQYTAPFMGTVTDTKTGLVWQQVDDGSTYTWALAKTHCTGLSLNGTGWRLPTVKELQTIVDDEVSTQPTFDPIFTGTGATFYWSTTPDAGSPSNAWYVNFSNGGTYFNVMTNMYRVRCVR